MANVDYETKMNSKSYRFFDLLFRLLVINVITIVIGITIVGLYPGYVAATATIKEGPCEYNVFKQYFINFKNNFFKSFFTGLILLVLYAVSGYAIYFYSTSTIKDGETDNLLELFLNAGFVVSFVGFIIITLLSSHLPQLIITFPSLTLWEVFRTSFYVTFRYFLTTFIMFIMRILTIGSFLACIFIDPRILAIWMLVGITLPLFIEVKATAAVYYKFKQINLEAIMHRIEEEEAEDEE